MATKAVEVVEKLVGAASLIFKATVTRLNASNEPTIPPRPGLVVGRVDTVLRASPALGNLVGQEITIQLAAEHPAPKVGEHAIFYTNDWIYGTQIAVREVAHREATADAEKDTIEALEKLPVRHLESRLDGAELVIMGVVGRIEPSPVKEPASFNAPLWKLAIVHVESILKGRHRGEPRPERVGVLFPSSDDWSPAPRFEEKQNGIFLLRHEPRLGLPPEVFTALDPADFQPQTALRLVQSLLPK
jgi:hypothetical protein